MIATKKAKGIIGVILLLSVVTAGRIISCPQAEKVIINDMLLYEHDNSDFYIEVSFEPDDTGILSDKLILQIVNSRTFNTRDEPDPVYRSTVKKVEIDYSSLPVKEAEDVLTVIRNAPVSSVPWAYDSKKHDLYILDDKYLLFQYLRDEGYLTGRRWWQAVYEADRETQAELIEHADYDKRMRYQFGPRYHATPEGQLQCIYKYENCVYYRQLN